MQRVRRTVGISDDSGLSSESESSDGEAGSAGISAGELSLRKDSYSDGSTDWDAKSYGKPVLENDEDGDGKWRHKTRREKKTTGGYPR